MSDYPSAFSRVKRKARKTHACCECGREIKKADQYIYSSGIWDGEPGSFKQCLNCDSIMLAASKYEGYDHPCFCELRSWFEGFICLDFNGFEWLNGMAEEISIKPEKLNYLLRVKIDD